MRRVLVIGSGGAGKSTVAARIGERLSLPIIHLDAHFWQPGWVEPSEVAWERIVRRLIARDAWVMDGNYGGTLGLRIAAADTVVFLDLPRLLCLWRVIVRRIRYHGRSRPDGARGCPERLTGDFIRWIWTYPRDRRPGILHTLRPMKLEKRIVTLHSMGDVRRFLSSLPQAV